MSARSSIGVSPRLMITESNTTDDEDETGYYFNSEPSLDEQDIGEFIENLSCKGQVLYERGMPKKDDLYEGLVDVIKEVKYTKCYTSINSTGIVFIEKTEDATSYFFDPPNEFGYDPVFYDEYLASQN